MSKKRKSRCRAACGMIFPCNDCEAILSIRGMGMFSSDYQPKWFMVKDRVWQHGQQKGECRFLCVECLEGRIDRKLTADDSGRSAKVNFVGKKSAILRRRVRGLKPAKRLINTKFVPQPKPVVT